MPIYAENLDIVIIGGSLAGLWAAVAIKSLPNISSITILERYQEEQLQDLGAGIRTNNEAIAAILEFTGTPPEKYAAPIEAYRSLDLDGNLTAEWLTKGWSSTWTQLYRVLRNSFDSDPKSIYQHGCTLHHLDERDKNHLNLRYLDDQGQEHDMVANIVIGADGASSKVRSLMLPDIQRTGVGYVVYRGLVPYSQLSDKAKKVYSKAGSFSYPISSQFASYPVPGNEAPADEAEAVINWVWYQKKDEDELRQLLTDKEGHQHIFSLPVAGMRQEEIAKLRKKTQQELPPQHHEVVAKTKEPFAQLVTDSSSEQNCFYGGKLLLIGDAVGGQR